MKTTGTSEFAERFYSLPSDEQQKYLKLLGSKMLSEANDLKRTASSVASDLKCMPDTVEHVFAGRATFAETIELQSAMLAVYPLSLDDLWLELPEPQGVLHFTKSMSEDSLRVFNRPNSLGMPAPYYEYRDTAMSRLAPFRPEWIRELRVVQDADPRNSDVSYNKGHLMNQFTFFLGEVNFYWEESGVRYCREMNTGDSCHISPYVPHTFASRNEDELGLIIAVTYGAAIRASATHLALDSCGGNSYLGPILQEVGVGKDLSSSNFNISLKLHFDAEQASLEEVSIETGIPKARILELLASAIPEHHEVRNLASFFSIKPTDLHAHINSNPVEIKLFDDTTFRNCSNSRVHALARSETQPGMKSLMLTLTNRPTRVFHACHEYLYNFGSEDVEIKVASKRVVMQPEDSCYIQPFTDYSAAAMGASQASILSIRLSGSINHLVAQEFGHIAPSSRMRAVYEICQWF